MAQLTIRDAYFGLRTGGIAAVSLKTGEKKWFTPLPGQKPGGPFQGQTAALTVIPGVVFSGGWDGTLRAFSTDKWQADLGDEYGAQDFKTVNGVKANGGTMASAGPTIVGGIDAVWARATSLAQATLATCCWRSRRSRKALPRRVRQIQLRGYPMRPRLVTSCALVVTLLVVCASMLAHHGNVAYDEQHPITIAGNVTEFVWSNPHCQIYLDVKGQKGNVVPWSVESQSPGILKRNGWTRDSIKPGDHVVVTLVPAKSGAPVGFSGEKTGKIVFDDGHVLKKRWIRGEDGQARRFPDIRICSGAGVVHSFCTVRRARKSPPKRPQRPPRHQSVTYPASGYIKAVVVRNGTAPEKDMPPMTPWAKARFDAERPGYGTRAVPDGNDAILQCDPAGFPRIMFFPTPFEFVQTSGRIIQFFEREHEWRPIWTDGRPLPKDPDPTWYGYAIGHWEGDYTFVIESSGFNDKTWLGATGYPHSEGMRVTERYQRADRNTIAYNIRVDDPKAYTKPASGRRGS